ncbi:phage head closure protein [Pseudorhodoferax sp. LjRoot39]|uniref:phage head closure protein n=1 Tax=Pseudorhodoferax sp. LjRoot39 TaxID=3342328 RepID=UPI003ECEA817
MTMEAGTLRHQVRIERLDYLRDETGAVLQDPTTGETARDWVEVATVWAAIEPLSAREFIASAKTQAEIVARIVIRYRDGLDASMRLVHVRTGRPEVIYNPADFLPDKESGLDYLTAPCSRGATEGQ